MRAGGRLGLGQGAQRGEIGLSGQGDWGWAEKSKEGKENGTGKRSQGWDEKGLGTGI